MWNSKDIYYISDSTGILVESLGQALTCQFPGISFHEETFPFIQTVNDAQIALEKIMHQSAGLRPVIFSTIMDPEVRKVLDKPEVEFFDCFAFLLDRLEVCLEAKALRTPGFTHHQNNEKMSRRVEAIHYCLDHDDGTNPKEYDEAELIILGVSRAGKTPVSVYLATQMGIKAANFPLTSEYLNLYTLPDHIIINRSQAIGLTTSPELLHQMREKRYAASTYAKLSTCKEEVQQAQQIFLKYNIPYISSAGKSIEEISAQICHEKGISRKK
jgi:hypothetical protein